MFQFLRKKLKLALDRADGIENREAVHLTKTTKAKHLLRGEITLSPDDIRRIFPDLKLELLQCDVAYETSERILAELNTRLLSLKIPKDAVRKTVHDSLREVLLEILGVEGFDIVEFVRRHDRPVKIVFLGVNGSGKTTTMAKVAHLLKKNNLAVIFAAGDTFRAGAIEQLEKHAQSVEIPLIKHQKGADSTAVIYDAVKHARARKIDVVLADTAGRMQTNINLMDEMKKICRVIEPDLKIFVGDALTGNDAVEQAEIFNQTVGIDAIILTKMDADPKGGCALSIVNAIKKPIILVGMGQGYDDLVQFDKEWFVNKIVEEQA